MNEEKLVNDTNHPYGRVVWSDLGMDPMELVEEEKWEDLISYADENMELLVQTVLSGNNDELADSVQTGAICLNIVETLAKKVGLMAYAFLCIGKLMGGLSVAARKLSYESQKRESEIIAEKHLSGVRHLDDIILILDQNGTMTHTSLAEQLGNMNPPTLTENMKKIAQYGLIYFKKTGKYKYYYLTDAGLRYAESLKKRQKGSENLDFIQRQLQELLNRDTTKEQTTEMLKRLLITENIKTGVEKKTSGLWTDADVVSYQEQEREKVAFSVSIFDNEKISAERDESQNEELLRRALLQRLFESPAVSSKKLGTGYTWLANDLTQLTPTENTRAFQELLMGQSHSINYLSRSSKKREKQEMKRFSYNNSNSYNNPKPFVYAGG